ncbi:hypothetical protein JCM3774_004147 [Rhodotorula dairenensis]
MYNNPPPPSYSHYQPAPQPISIMPPPVPVPVPVPPSTTAAAQQDAVKMSVGNTAGDFELFGGGGANHTRARQPRPPPGFTIPIPSSGSSSESSSIGDGDYPPVPELVADDAPSPPGSFSPPSPKFGASSTTGALPHPPTRPGLLPHANSKGSRTGGAGYGRNGSYSGFERASSVPAPECPRPMRRKTQESRDWPSFYSSGSSSSSSNGGGGGTGSSYFQLQQTTPGLTDSSPLVVDEPASFITPTATTTTSNPFDMSSFALSPAAQPYHYSASPPYPDHPLLQSEQSDLLDRVRRDLLDVDLSSIKGPLRALALSGGSDARSPWGAGDRETTPTQNSSLFPGPPDSAMLPSSTTTTTTSPNPIQWQYPLISSTPRSSAAAAAGIGPGSGAASAAQHLLRSPATSASDATVSPQEAFLDYDEVDSRLHGGDPSSRPRGTEAFVGAGASLFAPLPAAAAETVRNTATAGGAGSTRSPQLPTYAAANASSSTSPPPATVLPPLPTAVGAAPSSPHHQHQQATPTSPILRATSPRAGGPAAGGSGATGGAGHGHRRGPHPFSVPQNAVTWAEQRSRSGQRVLVGGDADDYDGDFGTNGAEEEEQEEEEDSSSLGDEPKKLADPPRHAGARGGFAAPRPPATADSPSLVKEEQQHRRAAEPVEVDLKPSRIDDDIKPFLVGGNNNKMTLPPSTTSFNPLLPLEAVSHSHAPSVRGGFPGFAPPPPPALSVTAGATPGGGGMSAFQQELARQRMAATATGGPTPSDVRSGTATPRRAAAASALAGLNDMAARYAASASASSASAASVASASATPEIVAPPPDSAGDLAPRRPQRQRKRSRMAMSAYGDDDSEDVAIVDEGEEVGQRSRLGFAAPPAKVSSTARRSKSVEEDRDEFVDDTAAAAGDDDDTPEADGESDESYRSSGSSFGATTTAHRRRGGGGGGASTKAADGQPPNKRRRRAPTGATAGRASGGGGGGGSNAPVTSGGIVCNHRNPDGTHCGVVFRRPYDLARHKETIHGEGLKGEKVKAKEWRCEECGGTFSRKDALLRHGRIRGHVTG